MRCDKDTTSGDYFHIPSSYKTLKTIPQVGMTPGFFLPHTSFHLHVRTRPCTVEYPSREVRAPDLIVPESQPHTLLIAVQTCFWQSKLLLSEYVIRYHGIHSNVITIVTTFHVSNHSLSCAVREPSDNDVLYENHQWNIPWKRSQKQRNFEKYRTCDKYVTSLIR